MTNLDRVTNRASEKGFPHANPCGVLHTIVMAPGKLQGVCHSVRQL